MKGSSTRPPVSCRSSDAAARGRREDGRLRVRSPLAPRVLCGCDGRSRALMVTTSASCCRPLAFLWKLSFGMWPAPQWDDNRETRSLGCWAPCFCQQPRRGKLGHAPRFLAWLPRAARPMRLRGVGGAAIEGEAMEPSQAGSSPAWVLSRPLPAAAAGARSAASRPDVASRRRASDAAAGGRWDDGRRRDPTSPVPRVRCGCDGRARGLLMESSVA